MSEALPHPRRLMEVLGDMAKQFDDAIDIDWGDDADEEIVGACDLENPETCESCQ
jgi:hypothetical protein